MERFIPTYVGHTTDPHRWQRGRPVHPHLRGAYSASIQDIQTGNGSSPPTWGILIPTDFELCKFRFIPTYVGHTGFWAVAY